MIGPRLLGRIPWLSEYAKEQFFFHLRVDSKQLRSDWGPCETFSGTHT